VEKVPSGFTRHLLQEAIGRVPFPAAIHRQRISGRWQYDS
jgi:hypothetical protein